MDGLPSEIDPGEIPAEVDEVIAVGFPTADDEAKRLIDPGRVFTILERCTLYDADTDDPDTHAVRVDGVVRKFAFSSKRLERYRDEVREMLHLLPNEFLSVGLGGGGGWTFLNACGDKDGTLWTGLHQRVEDLLVLGIALDLARWCLPREMWDVLPGGVPYVEIIG